MTDSNHCNKCLKDIKGDFFVKTPHETFWFCEDCFWEVSTKIDNQLHWYFQWWHND